MIALIPQIFAFGKTFSEGKSNLRNLCKYRLICVFSCLSYILNLS